ncbi:MAG: phosphoribosyltransferase, partial [Nitrososphaeria archaeon]|nr:phosphoribosyltransferase [Nitrososphaeria archaeon]NIQ34145.1 phosphoribosyltransferase [Nitrososphaeria archaeon]
MGERGLVEANGDMATNVVEEPAYRGKTRIYRDRLHAGLLLAKRLEGYVGDTDVCLLAIPAGGVPIGYATAKELHTSLDIIVVRKIQIPWNPEAGFGAVTWNGETILNKPLVRQLGLNEALIDEAVSKTREIIEERVRRFRGGRPPPDLREKTIILVDDGLASGFTMLAAAKSVKKENPRATIVAVPTASLSAVELVAP